MGSGGQGQRGGAKRTGHSGASSMDCLFGKYHTNCRVIKITV